MAIDAKKLETFLSLDTLRKLADKALTKEEFVKAFKTLLDTFAKLAVALNKKVDAKLASIKDGKDGRGGAPGPKGDKGEKGDTGKTLIAFRGDRGLQGQQGTPGIDGSPDTPKEVRDKLASLEKGEKLKIEAVEDLRKELDELKKQRSSGGGGIVISRGAVKLYDLSSQLDGVLKTFPLPAFWRVIDVKLWSAAALRPDIDYTVDGSNFTITFTSEIDAATLLAAGQTALVTYAEP